MPFIHWYNDGWVILHTYIYIHTYIKTYIYIYIYVCVFVQWFLPKNIEFQKIKEDLKKKKQQPRLKETAIDED